MRVCDGVYMFTHVLKVVAVMRTSDHAWWADRHCDVLRFSLYVHFIDMHRRTGVCMISRIVTFLGLSPGGYGDADASLSRGFESCLVATMLATYKD